MRTLFRSPVDDDSVVQAPPPAPTGSGWNSLSGTAKIGIVGGAVAVLVAVTIVPGLASHKAALPMAQTEDHQENTRFTDYTPPPAAQDPISRVTGASATAAPVTLVPAVPTPSEMSLYSGPNKTASENQAQSQNAPTAGSGQNGDGTPAEGSHNPLTREVSNTTELPTSTATVVRNPSYIIRPSADIPCLPIEAIDSSRPGFTSCRVPVDFRSSDQRRGLIPAGSIIFGQIREGISNGQRRLGVVYTLIETPWFDMQLAGPAADEMGRSGLDGVVHTFFWDKAGAVALYALMDVAVGAGQNLATNALSNSFGNGGTSIDLSSRANSLSEQEFRAKADRPPILTRIPALPMTVTVGQKLDFTQACHEAQQANPMACPLL